MLKEDPNTSVFCLFQNAFSLGSSSGRAVIQVLSKRQGHSSPLCLAAFCLFCNGCNFKNSS